MHNISIKVENLSKCYRIGYKEERHDTLGGNLASWIKSPFSNFRRLRNLSNFGEKDGGEDILWALKDVSFEVNQGEVVGIIGRNGAGKSTLLKILSRITEQTSGRITLNGRVSSLLEVGTGFHPELTGRENVYLNGTILGMKKKEIDCKFDEIVEFSGVKKFLDTPVKRYSSGMRVRLAFSVAAHLEPDILMIDEVLAVGDVEFQKKCLGKMNDVAKHGRTVLFVSHNMAAIQTLCDRAFWLDKGTSMLQSDVDQVVSQYLNTISTFTSMKGNTEDLSQVERPSNLELIYMNGSLNGSPLAGHHTISPKSDCEFIFTIRTSRLMRQCTMGIHFENETGVRVFVTNTRYFLKKVDLQKGTYTVRCVIPELPLIPANYYLTIGFSSDNKQIDLLERITHLEVAEIDVYGTGELPRQGYFLAEGEWDIQHV
ncbi:MAG: ABC transporter ATP-binding protein [Candidatus Brocadiaceae bacterium]|nr:ABC transporter ATP-binding protein [Candidatus Brocadiaceae bacterium]